MANQVQVPAQTVEQKAHEIYQVLSPGAEIERNGSVYIVTGPSYNGYKQVWTVSPKDFDKSQNPLVYRTRYSILLNMQVAADAPRV